MKTVITSLAST